jgi:hypothetical protein
MYMEAGDGQRMAKLVKILTIENIRQPHPEHPNEEHFNYCKTCGAWLKKKQLIIRYVCSECRHFAPKDSNFCPFCGQKFTGIVTEKWAFKRRLSDAEFEKATRQIAD